MTSTSTNEEIVSFALESLLLASTNRRSSHTSFSSSFVDRMSILKIPSDITNKLNQMYDKEIASGDVEENVSDNQSEANDGIQNDTDEKKKINTANCCVPYSGIKECQAWMMVSIGAGGFIPAMGPYIGSALLELSTKACEQKNSEKCLGFQPSSLLSVIQVSVGLSSCFFMPIIGAIVDHTKYRRAVGKASSIFITILMVAIFFVLNENYWFSAVIVYSIMAFIFIVHALVAYAYLPELTEDKDRLQTYIASFSAWQYGSMLLVTVLIIAISELQGKSDNVLETTRIAIIISIVFGVVFFGPAWQRLFQPRPATRVLEPGQNVIQAGFRELFKTLKGMVYTTANIRWFLIASSLTNAAVSTTLVIVTTLMNNHLELEMQQIGIAFLLFMIAVVIGAVISCFVGRWTNSMRSLKLCVLGWIITTTCGGLFLKGPGLVGLTYIFAVLWGCLTGWFYPTEKAAYCSMIPRGQEAEFMGLYLCANDILSWLPSLIFMTLNESRVPMHTAFLSFNIFYVLSLCFQFLIQSS